MPTNEEKTDQIDPALTADETRSAALKKRLDELANETDPPHPPLDHADKGGVI
jgi:hypothetical protein